MGKERTTYGMGVDSLPSASLEAAIKNLETSNWSWLPKHGYEVVQQSSFTTCEGKALVASYKIQPKGKGDTIVGFTAKEKAVNFKARTLPSENRRYVKEGVTQGVILWKTTDLGYLTIHVARSLVDGKLQVGATRYEGGRLGPIEFGVTI